MSGSHACMYACKKRFVGEERMNEGTKEGIVFWVKPTQGKEEISPGVFLRGFGGEGGRGGKGGSIGTLTIK